MSTSIRPEISGHKKYWIGKHRYYELKHFCLQYDEWKKVYNAVRDVSLKAKELAFIASHSKGNPTEEIAVKLAFLDARIKAVESTCKEAAPDISSYLLIAVTEDLSYDALRTQYNIPAGRQKYYDAYRRFFWLLDKKRG